MHHPVMTPSDNLQTTQPASEYARSTGHVTVPTPVEVQPVEVSDAEQCEYKDFCERQQAEIAYAGKWPYKPLSMIWGVWYVSMLMTVACLMKVFCRPNVTFVDRALGKKYDYVPEMGIHKSIELRAFLNHFARQPVAGKGVDLGCGDGMVGGVLIEAEGLTDLEGLDLYAGQEANVLSNGYTHFAQGNLEQLPESGISDNHYDYALSICVIEHIPNLNAVLSGVKRIVKPGGQFVFTTISPGFRSGTMIYQVCEALGLSQQAKMFQRYKDMHAFQYHYLSAAEWTALLQEHGYTDVSVTPIFTKQQLFTYDLMNLPVFIPRLYYGYHLFHLLNKVPALRGPMAWLSETWAATVAPDTPCSEQEATHFLIAARVG